MKQMKKFSFFMQQSESMMPYGNSLPKFWQTLLKRSKLVRSVQKTKRSRLNYEIIRFLYSFGVSASSILCEKRFPKLGTTGAVTCSKTASRASLTVFPICWPILFRRQQEVTDLFQHTWLLTLRTSQAAEQEVLRCGLLSKHFAITWLYRSPALSWQSFCWMTWYRRCWGATISRSLMTVSLSNG